MLKTCQTSLVLPMNNVSVCAFKTSPFVLAPRAHMSQHVCAWCRYKRGRFERTHGDVLSGHTGFSSVPHHTPHTTTQHRTTHNNTRRQRQTETEEEDKERRQGQRENRRRKRRDKTREEETKEKKTRQQKREDSFSVWWCMVVLSWWSESSG